MTRARILATSSLLGFALALAAPLAAPASAAGGMEVHIDAPGDGETFQEGNTVTVSGTVAPGLATVDIIQLQVFRGVDGAMVVDETLCQPCTNGPSVPFSYRTPALAYNGPYTVVVGTAGSVIVGQLDGSAARNFALAVPPPAPTGVAAEVLPDRRVQVTWKAVAGTPDLTAYAVYRKVDVGDFMPLAGVGPGTTTFTDESVTSFTGAIQYRVVALRQGASPSTDPNSWLRTASAAAVATLPALPPTTTAGGDGQAQNTTTTTALGGVSAGGGIGGADLSRLFGNSGASVPQLPAAGPAPTLPDTGFSETLPFDPAATPNRVEGRQQGRPTTASGSADIEPGESDESNRRALLVPVAAGSVLCVTALHLRWLNRRLAVAAVEAVAAGPGASGAGGGPPSLDLEPAEPDPDAFAPSPDRVPVGAGGRSAIS